MRYPAVPLALALLAGVSGGALPSEHVTARVPAEALVVLVILAPLGAAAALVGGRPRLFAAAAVLAAGLAGCALGVAADRRAHAPPLRAGLTALGVFGPAAEAAADSVHLTGLIAEDASALDDGARLALDVRELVFDGRRVVTHGRVWLMVAGRVPPEDLVRWTRGREVRAPAMLRRPARYLNPSVPDHEQALLRRGVALVGTIKSALLVEVTARGGWHHEIAARVRARARQVFDRYLGLHDPRSSAIVKAVVIGDRTGLDEETEERMQVAGTYHLLAISGGNIAILVGLLAVALRVLQVRSPIREITIMLALATYGWLVGGGASVARATLVAEVMLAARAMDRRSPSLNAMAVSAIVGLAWTPLMVFDPGAWLTYGASLAILAAVAWSGPPMVGRPAWQRAVAGLVAASVAAELALFPITAFVFSRVTAAGVLVNLAAVPLMSLAQAGALLVLVLEPLCRTCAAWVGSGVHLVAWALVECGRLVDVAPWLSARLPAPGRAIVALYYAALLMTVGILRSGQWLPLPDRRLRHAAVCASATWAAAALWMLVAPVGDAMPPPGVVRVTCIDVGQGDSTLIQTPDGRSLLVDAGGAGGSRFDIGGRVIAPVLWRRGVRRLTTLVVTHGDGDHLNGALAVVRDFAPREVWEGVPVPPNEPMRQLKQAALAKGAAWRTVQRGDRLVGGGVEVVVRHPRLPEWERQRVRNDDSVVVEVRMGRVTVLLTGDVESAGERELVDGLEPGAVRALQAAHHGSGSSSSWHLLEALRPHLAIVSAGRANRFGHPHAGVLARLASVGAQVFRTDRDGAVTLDVDGHTILVRTYQGRSARFGGVR